MRSASWAAGDSGGRSDAAPGRVAFTLIGLGFLGPCESVTPYIHKAFVRGNINGSSTWWTNHFHLITKSCLYKV